MLRFTSLFSGSSGNAVLVASRHTKILVDAGLSARRILAALDMLAENPYDLSALVITHEHIDHIRGAGIISRKLDLPIYANPGTWSEMEKIIGPVRPENRITINTEREFTVGEIMVRPFAIPHDAVEPVGYNFYCSGRKITIATDIGHMNPGLLENMEQSDAVLLESNHDLEMLRTGPYPYYLKKRILSDYGHLSNEAAGEVAIRLAESGTTQIVLGHLSKENNHPELAYQTVAQALTRSGCKVGADIRLTVALRDRVAEVIHLS